MKQSNKQNTHTVTSNDHPVAADAQKKPVAEQAIRERAYEIHEARGSEPGSPKLDWLEAEQQLRKIDPNPGISPRS